MAPRCGEVGSSFAYSQLPNHAIQYFRGSPGGALNHEVAA